MLKLACLALISLSLAACTAEVAPQEADAAANLCTVDDPDCVNPPPHFPSCSSYGCPFAPSSNPDQWSTCTTQLCYCRPSWSQVWLPCYQW